MMRIKVLDCTLRDGGYCNNWKFKDKNKRKIIQGLDSAGVEIIECGFLTDKSDYCDDSTKFNEIMQADRYLDDIDAMCVLMVNCGEYDIEKIPRYNNQKVQGIRLAFHKKNIEEALKISRLIINKGYKLFVQPMLTISYTKAEFKDLCTAFDKLNPYAFYIVDSFGSITQKQLEYYFEIANVILDESIYIGFHSHNNMQLAYSNAQMLAEKETERKLIIDSSVMGMGRGAGNLNTELFLEYLNKRYGVAYNIVPLLNIIDTILRKFYEEKVWGYSLENYISAKYNSHPNYASFLSEKNSLNYEEMNEIFSMMDNDKRSQYDIEYAKGLYKQYMERNRIRLDGIGSRIQEINGKKVLLIAPGKSAKEDKSEVLKYIDRENPVIIDINVFNPEYNADFLFVSNIRRYKELDGSKLPKLIITSNIDADNLCQIVDYDELKNDSEIVSDNAGMMAIKLCLLSNASEIVIVGMDGYDSSKDNYVNDDVRMSMSREEMKKLNLGMQEQVKLFMEMGNIRFLSNPKFMEEAV